MDMSRIWHILNTQSTRGSRFSIRADFLRRISLKNGFGPVIKSDFVEYFREVLMLEKLIVTMENGGFAEDGSRFRVVNNIYKADRELAARVVSIGGWLNLNERKLVEPPDIIKKAWQDLTRTEDFEELRSSIKK